MKKIVLFMMGAVLTAGLNAGTVADPILEFSSTGPDTYADGTAALPGECYALAYVAQGATFSLTATGENGPGTEFVLFAPVAKRDAQGNAYCPTLVYQVPASFKGSAGGSWGVYLLDTRVKAEDGTVTTAPVTAGKPMVINSSVAATEPFNKVGAIGSGETDSAVAGATTLGGTAAVLSVIDSPVITGIKPEGGKVVITVSGMVDAADYKVVSGFEPGAIGKEAKAEKVGNTFTVEADGATFFKVLGMRKFGE